MCPGKCFPQQTCVQTHGRVWHVCMVVFNSSPVACLMLSRLQLADFSESLGAAAGSGPPGTESHLQLLPVFFAAYLTCPVAHSPQKRQYIATPHCHLFCCVMGTGGGFGAFCSKLWFRSWILFVLAVNWSIQQPPLQIQLILVLLYECSKYPIQALFCHGACSFVLTSPQNTVS